MTITQKKSSVATRATLFTALLLCCASFFVASPTLATPKTKTLIADTILIHAKIYTANPQQPWAEALAIHADKIVAVGTEKQISIFRSPATKIIDAAGQLVLPGFTDCHIHFLEGSLSLTHANLEDAKNPGDVQRILRDYAEKHPGTAWIIGRGWNYSIFGPAALPDKKDLDAVFPDRPVLLESYDGHSVWANSKALALAHIDNSTPDPPNGVIVRDPATHEATGALKEYAGDLLDKVVPDPTRSEKLAALRAGLHWANQNGLTRVHSAGSDFVDLDLFDELLRHGELSLRFYIAYHLNPPELRPQDVSAIEDARAKFTGDWLATGAVKMFLDGVVESHTAAMLTPYTDDPSVQGKLFWDPDKYKSAVAELDKRNLQLFTHAIGEYAVRTALDSYQNAETVNHTSDRRPRIEHIETVTAADIPRFAKLGVIASMQPLHAYPDDDTLNVWARNAGPDRTSRAWSWKSIAADGGKLAFGSDWPVVTLNPWKGIQTAVTRQTSDNLPADGFIPSQRLTVAEAVAGYTSGAAFAGRRETSEGSLQPGKLADLIIVSQNIFEIEPHEIGDTTVITTIVGGRVVYQAATK